MSRTTRRTFQTTVETVQLYGSETWTLTSALTKTVDGAYTRMLRMALNVNQWQDRITNAVLYGALPRVSTKIQERRMKLAGHVQRHEDLTANQVLLWKPSHGKRSRGRPKLNYVDLLLNDTNLQQLEVKELRSLMLDRRLWRKTIDVRTLKPP